MNHISQLADAEGIKAMSLDADMLKDWLKDVIKGNDIKIVFVWDEFSGFFKQNRNSLDEFQKIVALCQEEPFYLAIVTHQTDSIISADDQSWSIVKQRFDFIPITLPDNLAFELIAHAFSPKAAATSQWSSIASDLNRQLDSSRRHVMEAAHVSPESKVVEGMLPIHPMTALVLKNIAAAFQSNQRSMFDFIKRKDETDIKAFQWFIENTGPYDDYPLLTIDMLWDFFYEKGRDDLTQDIKLILDTYPQQHELRDDQQRVLKTILIMGAIDKRLGGVLALVKPTDQNLSYAFEGTSLELSAKSIAKQFTEAGVLVSRPLGGNKFSYEVAILAGDQGKIEDLKKKIKKAASTEKLAIEGELSTSLQMSPSLALRCEYKQGTRALQVVTLGDFTKSVNSLKSVTSPWHFKVVLAVAKDDSEAPALNRLIRETFSSPDHSDLIVVSATATPLGIDDFEQYVDYAAMAEYYQGNNNQSAMENNRKAKQVLTLGWKSRIKNGVFYVHRVGFVDGERANGIEEANSILQTIILRKHPYILDFSKGLTESQFKNNKGKDSAKCGIVGKTSGVMVGAEKKALPAAWSAEEYWLDPELKGLGISIAKRSLDKRIEESFARDGQISIGEIRCLLEEEFGYAPCNFSAFLMGFLLRNYAVDKYRYSDSNGSHEPMSQDKMAEMIGNCVQRDAPDPCLVMTTPEEMSFYALTESVWNISPEKCASVALASNAIRNAMHDLEIPVWALKEVDEWGAYGILEMFISLIQSEGREAQKKAIEIGGLFQRNPNIQDALRSLVTACNCKKGMLRYLGQFKGGELKVLAAEIGAESEILSDVAKLFAPSYANLWDQSTGEEQLAFLLADYCFVKETNFILGESASSKAVAIEKWFEKLEFAICSHDSLKSNLPNCSKALEFLYKLFKGEDCTPERFAEYVRNLTESRCELKAYFDDEAQVFMRVYADYVDGITDDEVEHLKGLNGVFGKSGSEANAMVKKAVDNYKKSQKRTKLLTLWKEKTETKSPREWSERFRTPILALVDSQEYARAQAAFDAINRNQSTDVETERAIDYLSQTSLFESLNKESADKAFVRMLGRRAIILDDIDDVRDKLERLSIEAYEWKTDPRVQEEICRLQSAAYCAGGSSRVVSIIESMESKQLKKFLIELAEKDIDLGLSILSEEKRQNDA